MYERTNGRIQQTPPLILGTFFFSRDRNGEEAFDVAATDAAGQNKGATTFGIAQEKTSTILFFAFTAISLGNSWHHKKNWERSFPPLRISSLHYLLHGKRRRRGKDPPFRPPQFHGATWNLYICRRPSPRGLHKSAFKS